VSEFAPLEPSREKERPVDELDRWCDENFARLDEATRRRCVEFLRRELPAALQKKWRDQLERGVRIGSDDPWFHHGSGMAVRNALRTAVLRDEQLPVVEQDEKGQLYGQANWDDYYTGALRAALGPEPANHCLTVKWRGNALSDADVGRLMNDLRRHVPGDVVGHWYDQCDQEWRPLYDDQLQE
jgi:hypothetical protein